MRSDPIIIITCDRCGFQETIGLAGLAGQCYEQRNVTPELKYQGWQEDGDHHLCPDCVAAEASDAE